MENLWDMAARIYCDGTGDNGDIALMLPENYRNALTGEEKKGTCHRIRKKLGRLKKERV